MREEVREHKRKKKRIETELWLYARERGCESNGGNRELKQEWNCENECACVGVCVRVCGFTCVRERASDT